MKLSIRARLTTWYTGVVVVVLMSMAVTMVFLQNRAAFRRFDDEIARLMLTLQGVMRTELHEGLDLEAAAAEASGEVVAPDRVLSLTDPNGRLLAIWGQPPLPTWRPQLVRTRTLEAVTIGTARGRLLSEPVDVEGHRYVAHVWAPLAGLESEGAALRRTLLVSILIALGIAGVGGWLVGRHSLRPLGLMADQARAIPEGNPVARLTTPHATDELGTLTVAFNGLLDRLSGVLHAQRQFMADASHELRTPVSVVRSTAQITLAINDRSPEDYRESMTIVNEQAEHLAHLVDAMFLLSRAEAHGLPLVREVLYLDDLVADCARALRILAQKRDVRIDTETSGEIAFVGDDRLLRQLVTNLADNAVRHATTRVVLSTRTTSDGVEILVSDDGPGVAPPDQGRIFQRFVRLSPAYAGAGLGLPIARWIAEAHGGQLVLWSSGPAGSIFVTRLPLGEVSVPAPPAS